MIFDIKKGKAIFFLIVLIVWPIFAQAHNLPQGFVYLHTIDKSIHQKLEFATDDNCIGYKLDGYEGNQVVCTLALAQELSKAQAALKKINPNYSLRIDDAYRPVSAVEHIKRWAADPNDTKTKYKCYPDLDKKDLPGKYVAAGKSSHSRGSTVDIVIIDTKTNEKLDFGPAFFGEYAHYQYAGLTEIQQQNRLLLRNLMLKFNFKPYDEEFWHFTLKEEPFPQTYFDFPIKNES